MLQCNCTLLIDTDAAEAIVIDPGDEGEKICQQLQEAKVKTKAIVHTHAHVDHMAATGHVASHCGAPTYLHDADTFLFESLAMQAQWIGISAPAPCQIDNNLEDDQTIAFGSYELGVAHTPGHTPGSVCFMLASEELCFSGDTLFMGGIGRTDLPGGDFDQIEDSIRNRLYNLNGAYEVVPGHGPLTTIDRERLTNPFVRVSS
jgi:glyoxylase-like metal-dependent hydrolase (beta-lactamase superfamily II)